MKADEELKHKKKEERKKEREKQEKEEEAKMERTYKAEEHYEKWVKSKGQPSPRPSSPSLTQRYVHIGLVV